MLTHFSFGLHVSAHDKTHHFSLIVCSCMVLDVGSLGLCNPNMDCWWWCYYILNTNINSPSQNCPNLVNLLLYMYVYVTILSGSKHSEFKRNETANSFSVTVHYLLRNKRNITWRWFLFIPAEVYVFQDNETRKVKLDSQLWAEEEVWTTKRNSQNVCPRHFFFVYNTINFKFIFCWLHCGFDLSSWFHKSIFFSIQTLRIHFVCFPFVNFSYLKFFFLLISFFIMFSRFHHFTIYNT